MKGIRKHSASECFLVLVNHSGADQRARIRHNKERDRVNSRMYAMEYLSMWHPGAATKAQRKGLITQRQPPLV